MIGCGVSYYWCPPVERNVLKVIFPHAFNLGVPVARLAEIHSRGPDHSWMQKRAAVLTKELKAVRPEPGHTFIHAISMGAGEYYGSNRNGDFFNSKSARFEFPEPKKGGHKSTMLSGGLQEYHKTFAKYAAVYHDHINKDPKQASGSIVAEAYNPEMHRGELLIKVQDDKWAPEIEKLARGEDSPFSMSCKVPYDICSICGNQAPSRKEYCDHLLNEMSQVKAAGHQVFAINDRPLFFDFSGVFRPADRIAYGLQKVASTGEMPEEFLPSTQIAELWGISAPRSVFLDGSPRHVREKLAAIERMAAMEKQIEATGHAISPEVDSGVAEGNVPDEAIDTMRSVDWNSLMGALSNAEVCLPVRDFFRLILGNKYDSAAGEMDSVQSLLPGIFSRMSGGEVEDVTGMCTYDPATSLVSKAARDVIDSLRPGLSLGSEPTKRRIQVMIIRGGSPDGMPMRKLSHDLTPSKTAEYLAKQYAAYQLAFNRTAEGAGDGLATGLMVLRNYAA